MNPFEAYAKENQIVVICIPWPIKDRQFDCCAYWHGEPGGYAANCEEAIANLLVLDEDAAE